MSLDIYTQENAIGETLICWEQPDTEVVVWDENGDQFKYWTEVEVVVSIDEVEDLIKQLKEQLKELKIKQKD